MCRCSPAAHTCHANGPAETQGETWGIQSDVSRASRSHRSQQTCGSTADTTITPREQRQKVISGSASPSLCPPCSSAPTSKAPGRHKPPLCPTHPQVPRLPDVAAVPLAVLEDLGTEKGGMWHSGTGTGEHLPVCPDAGEEKGSGPLHHSSSGRSSSLSMAPKGQGFAWGSFKDAR